MKHDVKLVGSKAPASPRQACLALACLALLGVASTGESLSVKVFADSAISNAPAGLVPVERKMDIGAASPPKSPSPALPPRRQGGGEEVSAERETPSALPPAQGRWGREPVRTVSGEAPPPNVLEIIAEASRQNTDPGGRPLPLASSWDNGAGSWGLTGYPKYLPREEVKGRLNLQRQREMIEAGHHWLPVAGFPHQALTKAEDPAGSPWFNFRGHFEPWDTFAAWGLPVTFAATQFDAPIYNQSGTTDRWVKLPPSQNPNYIRADKVYRRGRLAAEAIATTVGSPTVRVTLPDASGVDTSPRSRIWLTQPVLVGGLQMSGERWQLTAVEGNQVAFTHTSPATETGTGGGIPYEVALVESVADPLGPIGPWREAGAWWLEESSGVQDTVSGWKNLQARYPAPPRLIFLSNNEGRIMSASRRNESRRYVDAHGDGTTGPFGNEIYAKGYAERFRELFAGMRGAMPEAWVSASRMVAYNAVFNWQYGRSGGWGRIFSQMASTTRNTPGMVPLPSTT